MVKKQKKLRGSVLVFSLLGLGMLLSAALSGAAIVVLGKNSARSTEKSALSFQIADGAAENILKRVYKETDNNLNRLADNLYGSGIGSSNPTCSSGVISGRLPSSAGTYAVTLLDGTGTPLGCNGAGFSSYSEWRPKLSRLVATGTYAGATRSIDVAVTPSPCGDTPTVSYGGDTYDTVQIGTQCWMKQNLNIGTRINSSTTQTNNGTIEKYCYSNSGANCTANHPTEPDGGLYMWNEAMQYVTTEGAQGICPSGWHIPTDTEWYNLENFLKDPGQTCNANRTTHQCASAGTKMRAGGASGFEGNISGFFNSIGGFVARDIRGFWWSSNEVSPHAWRREITAIFSPTFDTVARDREEKAYALPVRCIKD
ncbi:MAG: fibrobacter succinogenes major paralogous domain-containing protein [Candidatus Moraniibacteriota bacterium]